MLQEAVKKSADRRKRLSRARTFFWLQCATNASVCHCRCSGDFSQLPGADGTSARDAAREGSTAVLLISPFGMLSSRLK